MKITLLTIPSFHRIKFLLLFANKTLLSFGPQKLASLPNKWKKFEKFEGK
jgi:hypothetical protein